MTMRESIDKWVAPDYTPFEFSDGNILAVDIFSDVGATWRIVNKFIVNP